MTEVAGFIGEMRMVAMKFHRKDQTDPEEVDLPLVSSWKPTIGGYLRFLADNKLMFGILESIVNINPSYATLRNTGLERAEALAKDLKWFEEAGHDIPNPGKDAKTYGEYLETLAEKDPPTFICHFYNFYFAHTAGGRIIGKKVARDILNGRELEFYKWEGELPKLLNTVGNSINKIAEEWSREDKDRCLEETTKSFKYARKLIWQIIS